MFSKLKEASRHCNLHWKRIARSLGMPDIHIDELSNQTLDEIIYEIIEFWRDHFTYPFTVDSLTKILLNLHIKVE